MYRSVLQGARGFHRIYTYIYVCVFKYICVCIYIHTYTSHRRVSFKCFTFIACTNTLLYRIYTGVASRGSSIRIPRQCDIEQKGYLEDRRPASNCDPYAVTGIVAETCCL